MELAAPKSHWRALDIATGPGHVAVALAPKVAEVVGVDITPEMLAEAEKLLARKKAANVRFQLADAHELPFEDETFELVTCRRAAHHFADLPKALAEMARVLVPDGRLVLDDRSVPEDDFVDKLMNRLDYLHDESHVREYRASEWEAMLAAAGFRVETMEPYTLHRPLTALTEGVTPGNVAEIERLVMGLDAGQRKLIGLKENEGQLSLDHWYLRLAAVK